MKYLVWKFSFDIRDWMEVEISSNMKFFKLYPRGREARNIVAFRYVRSQSSAEIFLAHDHTGGVHIASMMWVCNHTWIFISRITLLCVFNMILTMVLLDKWCSVMDTGDYGDIMCQIENWNLFHCMTHNAFCKIVHCIKLIRFPHLQKILVLHNWMDSLHHWELQNVVS